MDFDDIYIEGTLTKQLDDTLAKAKTEHNAPIAVVKGLTGCGKSAITKSWLKHYNLENVYLTTTWLDENKPFDKETIEKIHNKNTIVVFDDYAYAKREVRSKVLDLVRFGNLCYGDGVYMTNVYPLMYVIIITIEPATIERLTDVELQLFGLEEYKNR